MSRWLQRRLRAAKVLAGFAALGAAEFVAGADLEEIWLGVDLSYVNELEDCGARFRAGGEVRDPYALFAEAGANLVRLRLWHNPDWTRYSTLEDVRKSIRRAHQNGMRVLLDFHYSDDWAHPGKQLVPAAWRGAGDTRALAAHVYDYTLATLTALDNDALLPEFVQIGNEINTEMLLDEEVPEETPIDWQRNVQLLNAGIRAVNALDVTDDRRPGIMIHIAQPEYLEAWLDAARAAGLQDFDLIGLSYYPKWSEMPFWHLRDAVGHFTRKYGKPLVIVETAYIWTLEGNDEAGNILGEDSLVPGYPASPAGQRRFMTDLNRAVLAGGGLGSVYWEPAWVSSACSTRWGQGSHWENAALFDYQATTLHEGAAYLGVAYDRDP